jgi:hypothetical protein
MKKSIYSLAAFSLLSIPNVPALANNYFEVISAECEVIASYGEIAYEDCIAAYSLSPITTGNPAMTGPEFDTGPRGDLFGMNATNTNINYCSGRLTCPSHLND